MNTVTYDGRTYRLPFADLFRPLTDDERTGLRESIESHGILSQVLIYDSKAHGKDCVIDGGHRLTIGAEMGVVVPIRKVKDITDEQAASRAESLNLDRRQLPPSEAKRRRTERVQRIAKMRTDGMSLPAIADHEGISVAQVRRDLETAGSTLPGGKVEPESGKVTGKDGKERPAHPQVSSSQGDADESQASGPDDEPAAIDADTADVDLGGEAQGDAAEPAGGGGSEPADSQPGEAAPAGQPLPLRDDEGNYLYPLDGEGDPDAPPADANWRLPDGSVERPGDLKVSPPDVMDDPAARVDRLRDRFKTLLKLLRTAGAELGELLTHHQAGRYLRRVTDDRGSSLFVERPRIIRSGKHEGGWHSPELSRLYDAVKQAAVDRLCVGCRGGGCDHCDGAGFFPAAADGAV